MFKHREPSEESPLLSGLAYINENRDDTWGGAGERSWKPAPWERQRVLPNSGRPQPDGGETRGALGEPRRRRGAGVGLRAVCNHPEIGSVLTLGARASTFQDARLGWVPPLRDNQSPFLVHRAGGRGEVGSGFALGPHPPHLASGRAPGRRGSRGQDGAPGAGLGVVAAALPGGASPPRHRPPRPANGGRGASPGLERARGSRPAGGPGPGEGEAGAVSAVIREGKVPCAESRAGARSYGGRSGRAGPRGASGGAGSPRERHLASLGVSLGSRLAAGGPQDLGAQPWAASGSPAGDRGRELGPRSQGSRCPPSAGNRSGRTIYQATSGWSSSAVSMTSAAGHSGTRAAAASSATTAPRTPR